MSIIWKEGEASHLKMEQLSDTGSALQMKPKGKNRESKVDIEEVVPSVQGKSAPYVLC